jgi:hypothetical protein
VIDDLWNPPLSSRGDERPEIPDSDVLERLGRFGGKVMITKVI